MPKYIDGFVIPIAKKKVEAYRKMAKLGAKMWMKYGALEYRECVGEDLNAPMGLSFPKGIQLKPGETVVFSWIVFKSRAHRDKVNAKVMSDPSMGTFEEADMPFDVTRMLYGGFEVLVEAVP